MHVWVRAEDVVVDRDVREAKLRHGGDVLAHSSAITTNLGLREHHPDAQ
jgi:hypothetical protein